MTWMYFAAIAVIIRWFLQFYQDGLSIWRSDKMGMEARIAAKDEMRHVSKYSTSSYWAATAWSLVRAVLIAGICFIIVYPVLVKFSSSLMTEADLFDVTVRWVPRRFNIRTVVGNYVDVYREMDYLRALFNQRY